MEPLILEFPSGRTINLRYFIEARRISGNSPHDEIIAIAVRGMEWSQLTVQETRIMRQHLKRFSITNNVPIKEGAGKTQRMTAPIPLAPK